MALAYVLVTIIQGCAEPGWVEPEEYGVVYAQAEIALVSNRGQVDVAPKFVREGRAGYPNLAIRAAIEGVVQIELFVNTDGSTDDVVVTKESGARAGFEQSAIDAAEKSTFTPATKAGRSRRVRIRITYVFALPAGL